MFRGTSRGETQSASRCPGAPRAPHPKLGWLALSLCLGACTVVLDFGDDKQLVASGGSAGASNAGAAGSGGSAGGAAGSGGSAGGGSSGGGAGGGAGSQTAGTHSGGNAGAAGVGGAADAGLCGADAAPVGPDAGNQLLFYFDAADQSGGVSDGDCSKDDSRLTPLAGTMPADCDYKYGVDKEWIQLFRKESIACVGCLSPTPTLWVEFLLQYKTPVSTDGTLVFQPLRGSAAAQNATYPAIVLNSQQHLGLKCGDAEQYATQSLLESAIVMLTYQYDFTSRSGKLYLRGTSEGYAIGQLQNPLVELSCDCSEPADGFFMRGVAGTGELLYDEIRAAENHAAIDDSY